MRGAEERLKIQAAEYERRLAELNHAHEKQVRDQQTYVSSEKFDGHVSKADDWQGVVDKQLAELAGRSKGITAVQAMVLSLIPIFLAIAAFFYRT